MDQFFNPKLGVGESPFASFFDGPGAGNVFIPNTQHQPGYYPVPATGPAPQILADGSWCLMGAAPQMSAAFACPGGIVLPGGVPVAPAGAVALAVPMPANMPAGTDIPMVSSVIGMGTTGAFGSWPQAAAMPPAPPAGGCVAVGSVPAAAAFDPARADGLRTLEAGPTALPGSGRPAAVFVDLSGLREKRR